MRTLNRTFVALVAALAAAGLLAPDAAAQHGGQGEAHGGMDAPHAKMGSPHAGHGGLLGHVPMAILHQQEALDLSEEQVERVEALQDSLAALHGRSMAAMQGARGGVEEAFGADGIDVEAYRRAVRAAADRRVEARVRTAEIADRALGVLDASQREKFLYGVHLMHRMHRMHGAHGMGHGMKGRGMEGHGMKGHGSMGGQCPMKEGEGHGAHGEAGAPGQTS